MQEKTAAAPERPLPLRIIFLLHGADVSQVRRRLIREYFRGIGFLHRPRCVTLVYHILEAIGEETLNEGEINYAG